MIRGQDYSSGVVSTRDIYHVSPRLAASFERAAVQGGDLLLSIVGYVGLVAEVPQALSGANLTQTTARLAIREGLRSRYFLHFLRSNAFRSEVQKYMKGSAQPGLNLADVEKMKVAFPVQAEEQAVIAQVLDTLDTAIHETEAIIAKLKAIKQGLLHDLLTRGIDANGELRPPQAEAPHLYKRSPLGWIPKEWEVRNLAECSMVSSGVTLGRNLIGHDLVELPYLRVANVQDGYVDLSEVKTVRILRNEIDRFALMDGDVLMNEGGDFDKLGRGTVWRAQIHPCLHQNHVFRVRCNRTLLMPDYLAAYSASQRGKAFFVLASKQSTNLASINSTQLKGFPVACPSPIEQRHIVEMIDSANNRLSTEIGEVQKLWALKSGLMDDLLTGRVRVTPLLEAAAP